MGSRVGLDLYDRDGRPLTVDEFADLIGGHGDPVRREEYRRVAADDIGPYWVSTVWIGTDYRFGDDGPPLIFETMVFGGDQDIEYVDRASSWGEALARHLVACAVVRCWLVLGRSVPGDGDGGPRACPRCNRVSHHPTDQAEGYCGRCHDWTMKP